MNFLTRTEVFGYNYQFLVTVDYLVHNHGLLDFSFQSIKHSNDDIHIHICDFLSSNELFSCIGSSISCIYLLL